MSDQHTALIKTPRQLITVVILAFVVPVIVIVLLANFVTGSKTGGAGSDAMTPEAVSDRLRPVGVVALQPVGGARALQGGEAVYKAACAACHAAGAAGAPKTGDAGAWGPRLKQGFDTLVKHAVEGFKGMPARGGNPDLDPVEVARAVAFMGNQAGGKFTEPAAPAAAQVAAAGATGRSGEASLQRLSRVGQGRGTADRRPRRVGQARIARRQCGHGLGDPWPRWNARARRHGEPHRPRDAGRGAVHVQRRRRSSESGQRARRSDRDRRFGSTRRDGVRGGQARWREGLRGRLQRVPRDWRGRRAEVRRQGRVGRAGPAGPRRADRYRGQGQGSDAAEGWTDERE
jgi:cytochrome c5